ncbi:hypothetical protein BJ165DRAFT_674049 [Panaeolus papilionaceus]|nr:hypothetical protein BJ165DRAFT_674049 [Panaeolus papilionaceus]
MPPCLPSPSPPNIKFDSLIYPSAPSGRNRGNFVFWRLASRSSDLYLALEPRCSHTYIGRGLSHTLVTFEFFLLFLCCMRLLSYFFLIRFSLLFCCTTLVILTTHSRTYLLYTPTISSRPAPSTTPLYLLYIQYIQSTDYLLSVIHTLFYIVVLRRFCLVDHIPHSLRTSLIRNQYTHLSMQIFSVVIYHINE